MDLWTCGPAERVKRPVAGLSKERLGDPTVTEALLGDPQVILEWLPDDAHFVDPECWVTPEFLTEPRTRIGRQCKQEGLIFCHSRGSYRTYAR